MKAWNNFRYKVMDDSLGFAEQEFNSEEFYNIWCYFNAEINRFFDEISVEWRKK